MSLLEVKNLRMYYKTVDGWVKAVDDVSFNLERGETLGIVGESGSGKTSLALSIIRVMPSNGLIMGGSVCLEGIDLFGLPMVKMNEIRWKRISMIFQASMNALNPVVKVGNQLIDALRLHENVSKSEAVERIKNLFKFVGLPASRINNYPFEFSGGMRQRVVIVMSLLCNPDIIIADEPTTALDAVTQDWTLGKIEDLQRKRNISMILITHDVAVVTEICEKIAVMYAGQIVEYGDLESIFSNPRHPYTMILFRSSPSIRGPLKRLAFLPGSPPNMLSPPPGCRFSPRCPFSKKICRTDMPPRVNVDSDHYSLCHFASNTFPRERLRS